MEKLKKELLFYTILILDFYLLPFFIRDTGSGMIFLLVIMPLICLITSYICGVKNGFHIRFPLITAALFAPSVFIFYNSSAWVYIVGYGVISLLGSLISIPFRERDE